jgi:hypothetical protein
MSWNVFPPSVLTSSTPPSKPRFGSTSDASRLKLCRNVNCVMYPSKIATFTESSRLSLTTAGSSMNAALGGVSAGGIGTPEFEVTHNGGGPCAFIATQSGGNAGGVTPSKYSETTAGSQKAGGHGGGLGATAARASIRPHPVTLFGGPADPHCLYAIKCAASFNAVRLLEML